MADQDNKQELGSGNASKPEESVESEGGAQTVESTHLNVMSARGLSAPRGTPHYRISAHHGMRPGTVARDLAAKSETGDESQPESGDASNPEEVESNVFTGKGVVGRGTPSYRISAHHGLRPGSVQTKEFTPESADQKEEDSEAPAS